MVGLCSRGADAWSVLAGYVGNGALQGGAPVESSIRMEGGDEEKDDFWRTVMGKGKGAEGTEEEVPERPLHRQSRASSSSSRPLSAAVNQCPHCRANFSHRSSLYRHVRTVHQRAYPFECSSCQAAFGDSAALEKHVQVIHERRRPFQCTKCGSAFQQRAHLEGHMKTVHLKQRPYKCDRCDAAFGQKPHLSRHIRTVHEKIRPFECDKCELKFSEKRSLFNHKRVKHPES
uniref:C2H2-type domain-containing protein n=1 Tax=Rhodosorus marinus TaxID=101924 RepID=A0A7S2ZXS5_9RHOD|mmetsp:Transcript_36910/g.147350  ORF Transcript_36910/g.147350 Transcript_36910/m.147350 type:complete len:231 (+) Transcript_36910:334-1026(+)